MSTLPTISNAPSLHTFSIEAKKDEAVALKKDGLQAQPAKLGFFGRLMQWARGENPARINSDTKEAFVAAMTRRFGRKAVDTALAKTGFHGGNDQPLTSREIKRAIGYAKIAERGSASQTLISAMQTMQKTQAETAGLADKVNKLSQHVVRLHVANDPRLGAVQAKLAETKQSLAQSRVKLNDEIAHVNQLASAASPVAVGSAAVKPSAGTSNATLNAAPARQAPGAPARELPSEARTQLKEQRAAMRAETKQNVQEMRAETKQNVQEMRAESKQNIQEMRAETKQMKADVREQAKLAREQSRAEQTAQRNERKAASAQAKADQVQQRELRVKAKLEHKAEFQQNRQKMRTSGENLLAQTSNMIDQQLEAVQAETDEYVAKIEAFGAALASPIYPR